MSNLSSQASSIIDNWGRSTNPTAGQALIDAAARSPYLASQLNQFFANGGRLESPPGSAGKAELSGGVVVIHIGRQLINNLMGSALAKDQFATLVSHELGHALSPGGMPTGTVIPTQAVDSSRRAEGVALASEMITAYQLGLGSNGRYSYSDQGQLGKPSGQLAQEFSQQVSYEFGSVSLWTVGTPAANATVNHSVSPVAQTYGLWSGQAKSSVAPNLTYDEYNQAWAALNACGPANAPGLIDWTKVEPGSVQLNALPDGSCRINTPKLLPRLNGQKFSLDATLDPSGVPAAVSTSFWLSDGPLSENSEIEIQSSIWSREDRRTIRTDAVTDKASNQTKVTVTDETTSEKREVTLAPQRGMTEAQYNDLMYGSMAGFLGALRSKDKLGIALNAARMVIDTARYKNDGSVPPGVLAGAGTAVAGLSATVGIVAGLHALQSDDVQVQLNGAVGLLSSANNLAALMGVTNASGGAGFLSQGQLGALATVGAVLSIANLKNLDQMLENGQVGSALATVVGAWKGVAALAAAASQAAAGGSFLSAMATGAAAGGPAALAVVVVAFVLDELFAEDPPPPPPVGWAQFSRNAAGDLVASIHDSNELGDGILKPKMAEVLNKLRQQLADANAQVADPERQLVLIASRLPKVYIQSWQVGHNAGNGETNYIYYAEMKHPQTGQVYGVQIPRQELVNDFAGLTVGPEALVQRWQATHMAAKFGADEAKWQTEGQWAMAQSPLERQRTTLTATYQNEYKALQALKETRLVQGDDGTMSTAGGLTLQAHQAAVAAQQAKVDGAYKALVVFSTRNPLGYVSEAMNEQGKFNEGINPQAAAMIVDGVTQANLAGQEQSDPEAWQAAWSRARQSATQQWMKVIALDWNGDGAISKWMPQEVAAGSDTSANGAKKFNVGTLLQDLQTDGFARFDVDGDGYREATQWVASTDALLGIDRDGNGVIDTASELFNGPNTPFDQRGWASLKYYDSDNDGKITSADAVWKLLRVWVDVNGDGAAGQMETLTLDMDCVGVDMAKLKAGLDAAGQQALVALKRLAVGSIDLATMKLSLADGSTIDAHDERLKADTLGTAVVIDDKTQNVTVFRERPHGANPNDSVDAETWITFVEDMGVLQELQKPGVSDARKAELRALAQKYGLNPDAADFDQVLKNLVKGGENVGGSGTPTNFTDADVWLPDATRTQLSRIEALRQAQRNALNVLSTDVLSGQLVNPGLSAPVWATTTTENKPFDDRYVAGRQVALSEIDQDEAIKVVQPVTERWVFPSNMYNLDQVVRGGQQGGLAVQQAVVVSQKLVNGQLQSVAPQTVQTFQTNAPIRVLNAAIAKGEEDERLSLGYLQLEQEARDQLVAAGGSPLMTLRMVGVREVRNGSVVLDDALGILRFVAAKDYVSAAAGDVGFTYVLADEAGNIYSRTVNYTLSEVNDAPLVAGETVTTTEDVPLVINLADLLRNDTDKEGDALQIVGIGRVGMGRATLESNGQLRYVPPADQYGTTDTVEYLVRDARGAVAVGTIKIAITAANDAPVVRSEVIRNAQEDVTLRIQSKLLLANDFDPDVDARTGAAPLRITAVGQAVHGQVFLDGQGDVIFVPEDNFFGKASFSYTVTDPTGLSTVGRAEVEVNAVNDAPVATGESVVGKEDQQLVFDTALLLANDTDIDIQRGEAQRLGIVAVANAVGGQVELSNGKIIFTPTLHHFGQASFDYVVSDNAGGLSQATVKISLNPVNDLPVAPNRTVHALEDQVVKVRLSQLLEGIRDVEDGTQLTASAWGARNGVITRAYDASVGEDVITFTPHADFFGEAGFTYTVTDKQGGSSNGQMRIQLAPVNDVPVALERNFSMMEDAAQPLRIRSSALLAGLVDKEDGTALNITVSNETNGTVQRVWDAAFGEHVYLFQPTKDYNGLAGFVYTVTDREGGSSSAAVKVNVSAVNDAPTFIDDSRFTASGEEDQDIRISESAILKMFSDVDGDRISLDLSRVKTVNAGDTIRFDDVRREFVFTPLANAHGLRQIDVAVVDAAGARSGDVRIDLNVRPVNDAPRANASFIEVAEDGISGAQRSQDSALVRITFAELLKTASDVDGDRLTISAVHSPSHAGMQLSRDENAGVVSIRLPQNHNGFESFSYVVSDGKGGSVTQTARLHIRAVDDTPTFSFDNYQAGTWLGPGNAWWGATVDAVGSFWVVNAFDVDDDASKYQYSLKRGGLYSSPKMSEAIAFRTGPEYVQFGSGDNSWTELMNVTRAYTYVTESRFFSTPISVAAGFNGGVDEKVIFTAKNDRGVTTDVNFS